MLVEIKKRSFNKIGGATWLKKAQAKKVLKNLCLKKVTKKLTIMGLPKGAL